MMLGRELRKDSITLTQKTSGGGIRVSYKVYNSASNMLDYSTWCCRLLAPHAQPTFAFGLTVAFARYLAVCG